MAGARELLGGGHAGRSRADHRDPLAGLHRRDLRLQPAILPGLVDDRAFDRLDGDRRVFEVQRARRLARRRADAAGEFREVVGRMEVARGLFPIAAIDEVVPVRDLVVHRAAGMAVRNAAIHAARRLVARAFLAERDEEFAVVANAIGRRQILAVAPVDFQETRYLTHISSLPFPKRSVPLAHSIRELQSALAAKSTPPPPGSATARSPAARGGTRPASPSRSAADIPPNGRGCAWPASSR